MITKAAKPHTLHYLAGALIVTGMVTVWIVMRAIMTRHQKRSEDSK